MSEIPSISIANGYDQDAYLMQECINHYRGSYVFRKQPNTVVLYRQTNRLAIGNSMLLIHIYHGSARIPILFEIVEAYTQQ